jgi:hypothetical protein
VSGCLDRIDGAGVTLNCCAGWECIVKDCGFNSCVDCSAIEHSTHTHELNFTLGE